MNVFHRDCQGSLAVEFAVILPLVFALVFGVIDVSRVLLARSLVDYLAFELADEVKFNTPEEARAGLTVAALESRLTALTPNLVGSLVDTSRLTLTVSAYDDLASFANDIPAAEANLATAGVLIAYRLDYGVSLITPFVHALYDSGDNTETAVVVVKNVI